MSLSTKVIKYAGNVIIAIPDGNAALNGDAHQAPTFTIGIFSGHIAKKMVDSPGTSRYIEGNAAIIPGPPQRRGLRPHGAAYHIQEDPMSKLTEVNKSNFESLVTNATGLVLIDFWAPWCGPCKMQVPILEKLAQSDDIKANIVKINTDENPELAQNFGISSIPTLVLMKDGTEIERFVGVQPEAVLTQKLSRG